MKITNIDDYIISEDVNIQIALNKINANGHKTIFVVDKIGKLKGSFSDGDFRRWLLAGNEFNVSTPIGAVCNLDVRCKHVNAITGILPADFERGRHILPVVNDKKKIIYFITEENTGISIGNHRISASSPPFIIAEIGNNHQGSIDTAKTLVLSAKDAGATCVKFQLRSMKDLYGESFKSNRISDDLGSQYTIDLIEKYQLPVHELFEVFDFCKSQSITALCTPWDLPSLEKLEDYDLPAYKVSSADLTNHELLARIASTGKPLICSTGMSTEEEVVETVKFLEQKTTDFLLLHCNSTYPTPYKDINLNYMKKLEIISGRPVGYSGHERGIHVPIAAVSLGAKIIEKHITLDRSQEGADHKVSLLPSEFKEMVKCINDVYTSLGNLYEGRKITQGETINRQTLSKSIFVKRNLSKGETIVRDDLVIRGPGRGLQPNMLEKVVGLRANRNIKAETELFSSDLSEAMSKKSRYHISRIHGIPVRFHDIVELISGVKLDLVEFHLSYKDMEEDFEKLLKVNNDLNFSVHCPELFPNDHLLDLASFDEKYRARSLCYLNETIQITHKLQRYFPSTLSPTLIVNAGGWCKENFFDKEIRLEKYQILHDMLNNIQLGDVNLAIQTMPPFPWHFGGQSHHNLFVDPIEIKDFCEKNNSLGICLDTSHSMMACSYYGWDLIEFIKIIAPHISYIHLADSSGIDGEGINFGEGDIDFGKLLPVLDKLCADVPIITEVWQGHINDGAGFWRALEYLEALEVRKDS